MSGITSLETADHLIAAGQLDEAERDLLDGLEKIASVSDHVNIPYGLAAGSAIAAQRKDVVRAGTLWGALEATAEREPKATTQDAIREYTPYFEPIRDAEFEGGRSRGRKLSLEELGRSGGFTGPALYQREGVGDGALVDLVGGGHVVRFVARLHHLCYHLRRDADRAALFRKRWPPVPEVRVEDDEPAAADRPKAHRLAVAVLDPLQALIDELAPRVLALLATELDEAGVDGLLPRDLVEDAGAVPSQPLVGEREVRVEQLPRRRGGLALAHLSRLLG